MRPHSSSLFTRRRFVNRMGLCGLASFVPFPRLLLSQDSHASSNKEAHSATQQVVRNRAPLSASTFYPLPLGSIRPRGWLKEQLQIQASGLGGHLDETWADVGPNSGWLGGT